MANHDEGVFIRMSHYDRAALRELAARLKRTQSETLCLLVRETLAVVRKQDAWAQGNGLETESTSLKREEP